MITKALGGIAMKNITKTQAAAIALLIFYFMWQVYGAGWGGLQVGTIISIELYVMYPILIVLTCNALYQFVTRNQ